MFPLLLLLLLFSTLVHEYNQNDLDIVCRDENGDAVDWYYLYKLPTEYSKYMSPDEPSSGLRYLYISPTTAGVGWKLSEQTIDDPNSFPGKTISNLLDDPNVVFIAYNDEPPDGPVNFENGHTKGVIAADSKSGIWLIHSVPKYPEIGAYSYPQTGRHYGQSFLCLSFNASQIDLVGKQQVFNEPNIYYSQIPDGLRDMFPNLVKAVNEEWQTESPYWNYETLKTRGGVKFTSFAKGRNFRKELYEDWVAPTLGVGLLVESWRHGTGVLPTNCTKMQHVLNVESIEHSNLDVDFPSTRDHSKWCVAENVRDTWICVGDINRAEHQLERGGGTVCQLNTKISTAYRNLISEIEPCPVSVK